MYLPSHICHLHSSTPGPRVVILGATHGDEITGQLVVKQILESLGLDGDTPSGSHFNEHVRGDLFLGIGNPEALALDKRGVSKERDLNRSFRDKFINDTASESIPDQKRANELAELLASADYLFDLHAVTSEASRTPFVCIGNAHDPHREIIKFIPVPYILTDSDFVLAGDVGVSNLDDKCLPTTDEWVTRHGGVGICYETGYQKDLNAVPQTAAVVARLLLETEVVTQAFLDEVSLTAAPIPETYPIVYKLVLCVKNIREGLKFSYVDEATQCVNWREVKKGELLGSYSDGTEVRIERDGMLIFPTASAKVKNKGSLYYIAEPV